MERLYNRIINEMTYAKIIDDDQDTIECYHYGLELVTTSLIIFVVMFVISLFTKTTLECILFAVFFCPLRAMSGGYHCKTFFSCFFLSLTIWVVYIFLSDFSLTDYYSIPMLILYSICCIYISVNAPLEHQNNPLLPDEKNTLKRRIRFLLILYALICIMFTTFKITHDFVLYYSIFITAILMILSKDGGESNNESNMSEADSEN